jgi:hypothetical protein
LILNKWGNVAGVIGLLASFVGFWFTIKSVIRVKRAAQQAEAAAQQAKARLRAQGTIANFFPGLVPYESIRSTPSR